jgi:hypothetical protein
MTENHPITPPPELVREWQREANHNEALFPQVAAFAAQWGADQELESILELAQQQLLPEEDRYFYGMTVASIRAARRPKPPSLKEQAQRILVENGTNINGRMELDSYDISIIRHALEAPPE